MLSQYVLLPGKEVESLGSFEVFDDFLGEHVGIGEIVATGVARGVGLTTEELREMIQSYYQARQWDKNGLIPEPKLRELGIPTAPRGGKQCQVMKPAGC